MHRCDHLGIFTSNSKRLISFYTQKLGFTMQKEDILSKSLTKAIFGAALDCKFYRLVSGNLMLEIFEPERRRLHKRKNNTSGFNHFGFCVDDPAAFVRKLRKRKVRIIEIKRNGRTACFVADPDGNIIEIRKDKK